MSHATEGMLQAYLDEEVTGAARHGIAEHLGACAACAAELDALRVLNARAATALAALDRPVAVEPALRTYRASRTTVAAGRRRVRWWRGSLARAAMLVLVVTGLASAAIPGLPVRQWLANAWDRVATFFVGDREPIALEPPIVEAQLESGVAILPHLGRIQVARNGVASEATIRIELVDGPRAAVTGAAPGAHFSTARGWIEGTSLGAGEIVVELPVAARTAIVEVNGVLVATKEGDGLVAHAPTFHMTQTELRLRPGR
jgi:hypothetical protein